MNSRELVKHLTLSAVAVGGLGAAALFGQGEAGAQIASVVHARTVPDCNITRSTVPAGYHAVNEFSSNRVNELASVLHVSDETLVSGGAVVGVECGPGRFEAEKSKIHVDGVLKACVDLGNNTKSQGDVEYNHVALCVLPQPVVS